MLGWAAGGGRGQPQAQGVRDRAILAVLLGCGLRRSEIAALTLAHVQQRDGRWVIVDLVGKHHRVRSVPMPNWTRAAIDAWAERAGISDGRIFRSLRKGDGAALGAGLSTQAIADVDAAIRRGLLSRGRARSARASRRGVSHLRP